MQKIRTFIFYQIFDNNGKEKMPEEKRNAHLHAADQYLQTLDT
jgi:hypothetical protein